MKRPTIVCVDDEKMVLVSLRDQLGQYLRDECAIEVAESGEEALELIPELIEDGYEVPLIISDQIMPGMKGDELLIQLHQSHPDIMKIMLTGQASADAVGRAVNQARLYRYISKPWEPQDLALTTKEALRRYFKDRELDHANRELAQKNQELERACHALDEFNQRLEKRVEERTRELEQKNRELEKAYGEIDRANRRLDFLANFDELTQIANRRHFNDYCEHVWKWSLKQKRPLAMVLCDVDFFKRYNDHYGHPAGDTCLKIVAEVLAQSAQRQMDLAARYGGEEFAMILPNTDLEGAIAVGERLCAAMASRHVPHEYSDAAPHVTLSIGVTSTFAHENGSYTKMLQIADEALYQAKQSGRNRVVSLNSSPTLSR